MCTERSIAVYHTAGATIAGTAVTIPDINNDGNIWKNITVVNDTDQDVSVELLNTSGIKQAFIIPKSIKGFTRVLRTPLDNLTLRVFSLSTVSAAAGKITFNLAS